MLEQMQAVPMRQPVGMLILLPQLSVFEVIIHSFGDPILTFSDWLITEFLIANLAFYLFTPDLFSFGCLSIAFHFSLIFYIILLSDFTILPLRLTLV